MIDKARIDAAGTRNAMAALGAMLRLSGLALGLMIGAQAAVWATPALLLDADSGEVLHAEEAADPWYPASTTKLMTAYVTFEALAAGEVRLDTPVILSRNAMSQPFLQAGLAFGDAMTLEDALYAMVAGSANDVAVALAETVAGSEKAFVARMNEAAIRLGLSESHFVNPNGLADPDQQVSARDLALIGLALDRRFPQYRPVFQATGVTIDGKRIDSHNDLLRRFPGTIGMKTGFLCDSGRNLVALTERNGRRLMVVLLGATTGRERAERAAQLLSEGFAGDLRTSGQRVDQIAAPAPGAQPENMRLRLCSDQTAAYEASRNALYPMGLGGNASYLSPESPPVLHAITTWHLDFADVPLPMARPSDL